MWTRRRVQVALVVVGSVLVARGLAIAPHARADQPAVTAIPDFKVTLLGTGTPNPRPDRFGPSTLVEAGPERLVFDCGRSCTTRLWQLKIPLGTVKLFITHLHSDHTVGIPDLWLTGWLTQPYGTRKAPFRVWGPEGTVAMMSNLEKSYEADIHIRQPQGAAAAIDAKDFTEGVVYQENGVRVTAFKVAHADINGPGASGPENERDWRGCRERIGPAALKHLTANRARFELLGSGGRFGQIFSQMVALFQGLGHEFLLEFARHFPEDSDHIVVP